VPHLYLQYSEKTPCNIWQVRTNLTLPPVNIEPKCDHQLANASASHMLEPIFNAKLQGIIINVSIKMLKDKTVPAFAFWGSLGFAIGGAIGGAIWFAYDAPYIGFAILGAFGGAWLGAILKGRRRAWKLALNSAIGFDIGFMAALIIPFAVPIPVTGQGFFIGAIAGALSGGSMWVALRKWRRAGVLALASAIGFGIALQFTKWARFSGLFMYEPQVVLGAATVAVWGAIGGASLGIALGYLHNRESLMLD